MYLPKHFEEARIETIHALLRERPFATLATSGAEGLTANHVPMEYSPEPAPHGVLRFHVARMNPLWQELVAQPQALAVFQGPEAYITPAWYPEKQSTGKVVPTWNYTIVHAKGRVAVKDDPVWLRAHLERLVNQQEAGSTQPWKVSDAPEDYTGRLLNAIVGLELTIESLQGKWKVSQNRAGADREGVVAGLRQRGKGDDLAMADLVEGK